MSSAASREKPPTSTDRRRRRTCWAGVSRSWLHSTARWRVWWRPWAVRLPRVRRWKRSSRRAAIWSTSSAVAGRGQLDGQRDSVEANADLGQGGRVGVGEGPVGHQGPAAVDEQPGRLVLQQRLDGEGRPSWRRGRQRRHPPEHLAGDAQRLPAGGEPHRSGQARRRASTRAELAARTCSQLSTTKIASRGRRWSTMVSTSARGGCSTTPMAAATVRATRASSPPAGGTGARSTNQLPSAWDVSERAATSKARRVLPDPAEPVRVISRSPSSSLRISRSPRSRPTKVLSRAGRLLGGWPPVVAHTTSRAASRPCSSRRSER